MNKLVKALEEIKDMDADQALLKTADVLHNMKDLITDIEKEGDKTFSKFKASKEDTLKRYTLLIKEFRKHHPDTPLLPEIAASLEKLLNLAA